MTRVGAAAVVLCALWVAAAMAQIVMTDVFDLCGDARPVIA